MPAVRRAVVDGLFYPAAPAALRAQVADYLAGVGAADDAARAPPKLLITPHAGYDYCGAMAAHAYALLGRRRARSISRVVLLGPAHRVARATAWRRPEADAFETPLGEVALDVAALASLDDLPQVVRERPRARARAFARGSAAFPADAARQLHPRAAGRRRRRRRGGGAGARAAVGRRRDADRDQLGPLALPAVRAGASRRPRHRAAHPGARCRPRAARGLRRGGDQWRAAGGAPPRPRAAPARSAQLRRHRGRPRSRRRLRRVRIRGAT